MKNKFSKLIKLLNKKNYKKTYYKYKSQIEKYLELTSPNSSELFDLINKTEFSLAMYYNEEMNKILDPKFNIKQIFKNLKKTELSEKQQKQQLIQITLKLEKTIRYFQEQINFIKTIYKRFNLKPNQQSHLFQTEKLIQEKNQEIDTLKKELNQNHMLA